MTTQPGSRRSFMRHLGIGGAAALGAVAVPSTLLAASAGAQGTSGTGSGAAAALPAADQSTATFLEGVELAMKESLDQAVARRVLDASETEFVRLFAEHHRQHAAALATAAGRTSQTAGTPDQAVLALGSAAVQSAAGAAALIGALAALEERTAATFQVAMGQIATPALAGTVARVLAVDAQQATVLGIEAGLPQEEWAPLLQPTAGAFTPAGA